MTVNLILSNISAKSELLHMLASSIAHKYLTKYLKNLEVSGSGEARILLKGVMIILEIETYMVVCEFKWGSKLRHSSILSLKKEGQLIKL